MDFETASFAFERSTEIGLPPAEVSFLLGKKDAYFFDLLNPTDKNKLKTEQPDLLPAILDCKIRQIIPNDVQPDEQVTITGAKTIRNTKDYKIITYRLTVEYNDKSSENLEKEGEKSKEYGAVTSYLLKLIKKGHFDQPKLALTIYLLLQENLEAAFTAKRHSNQLSYFVQKTK